MKQVFLSGHGGWTPDKGYTAVPAGCKINFYTDFAKLLMTDMEYQILDGTYSDVERTIEEFKQCPNMTLYAQATSWTEESKKRLQSRNDIDWALVTLGGNKRIQLSSVFKYFANKQENAEFHWLACQDLGLKAVGGQDHGVNACDFKHHDDAPARFRVTQFGTNGQVWMGNDGVAV